MKYLERLVNQPCDYIVAEFVAEILKQLSLREHDMIRVIMSANEMMHDFISTILIFLLHNHDTRTSSLSVSRVA